MKKFLATAAVIALVALAAPAFAATNPFMDVPINHWAYDAIGQLAAHGILSGYPDGTYKGKQPTTRYEMASAIARALGYIDINKASRQDVEMLKKLVVEFKDELDALGVRVDELSDDVAGLRSRLGGWRISGVMRVDLEDNSGTRADGSDYDNMDGRTALSRSRLLFERWFGEDESMKFTGRYDTNGTTWQLFNVAMPAFADSRLTVGRFAWDKESNYYLASGTYGLTTVWLGHDAFLTDRYVDGFGWEKSFGLGKATAYLARTNNASPTYSHGMLGWNVWELFAMGEMQFTENLGFDLGFQYVLGDDASTISDTETLANMWTVFAGLRFNFNQDIELKGIYYYQDSEAEVIATGNTVDHDGRSAFKLMATANQNLLKFTNLWLEYDFVEAGFIHPTGASASLFITGAPSDMFWGDNYDTSIFRVAARQEWTEKWATFLYFSHHMWDQNSDPAANQYAVGVQYKYNPSVNFGLAYVGTKYNDEAVALGSPEDHSLIRFRTEVWF